MTSPCTRLKSTPEAYKLCRNLVYRIGWPTAPKRVPVRKLVQKYDTGVPYIKFNHITKTKPNANPTLSIVPGTKGDGKLQVGELLAHSKKMPWDLGKFAPKIKISVKKIEKGLIQAGYRKNTKAYNTALARKLIAFVVRKKSKGGLGIKPLSISADALKHEHSFVEILSSKNREAHCRELCYIFYHMFKMAGLKPSFRLVYKDWLNITSLGHVCIGIQLDPAKPKAVTLVDLTEKKKMWFNTPHKITVRIPHNTMLGLYYNNKACVLYMKSRNLEKIPGQMVKKIKALFTKGFACDTRNPILWYNFAIYYRFIETNNQQRDLYLKGTLKLYPTYSHALTLKALIHARKHPSSAKRNTARQLPGLYE